MPRKEQKLTCTFFVGGRPIENFTEEQLETMARRLEERMSIYYTAHPEEFIKIKGETKP